MDKYIGRKLEGRYEIQELIGFGGMAVVFKAWDLLERRYVAVKILKDEYLQSEDFKRRFRNESKAIALLSHPNIVRVLDVNFDDHIQYIVMEYIDGITLKEYIEQQKVVRWKECIHFTIQILRALQHAHDNGIVHRDIKPQNVMLLENGTIKVMDFGIARFARETGKTMSDKAIGSVHYISPEQARGEATDEKTDIYAVGVMMYEMLTGQVPFDGDTPVSIAIKQMQIEPRRPTSLNPEIPIGLEEIVLRAMQKDPQLRYLTAAEMLRDIDEFKHNPDVVFEYRYLNTDGSTKYFSKIDNRTRRQPEKRNEGGGAVAKKKTSYTMNILAGVTAACVILAIVALYFFFKALDNRPGDVVLINLVGMTVEEAQQKMPDVKIVKAATEASNEYGANVIIEMSPDAGTTVRVDTEVQVTISSGLKAIVVPELENELLSTAKSKLEHMGLVVETNKKTDDEIPAGNVIMSDPEAGAELKKGDRIILYVSMGAPDMPSIVPNLLGRTEVEARGLLSNSGLRVGKVESVNSNETKGTIVFQSEDPDTRVNKGTSIDIQISNGVPERSSVEINLKFPADADDIDYMFDIYINDQFYETRYINPFIQERLTFTFETDESGTINGSVPRGETNEVMIMVDSEIFAIYDLDFAAGTANPVKSPDFEMVKRYNMFE